MKLTEEMKKNLPLITVEELKKIRVPKKELIEMAIREFNDELKKDIIEAIDLHNYKSRIEGTIPDIGDYISGISYENEDFIEKKGIYKETIETDADNNNIEKIEQTLRLMFGLMIQRTYCLETMGVLVIEIEKSASKNEVGRIRHFMHKIGYDEFAPPLIYKGLRTLAYDTLIYKR